MTVSAPWTGGRNRRRSQAVSPRLAVGRWFWVAVLVSLAISFTPWAQVLLYPFKLFTTWVHESSHALMTVLVGGRVQSIVIEPDTSGLTQSLLPAGRVARGLVASAGYLGAAIVGCLLMASTRVEKWAHGILQGIGVCLLLTLVLWIRNPFGAVVVLAWGVALIMLGRRGVANAVRFLLSLLAIQVALNAVYDIRVLFLIRRGHSDAATMAQLFLLPAWVWATAWMVVSVALLSATLWTTGGRR
ncbi:MAG TPA: M50 family metallopeptidase [Vicinamibacterales bacterium]|nr:M50 family metallopeptidase [Vicinamibacterales bacterium]